MLLDTIYGNALGRAGSAYPPDPVETRVQDIAPEPLLFSWEASYSIVGVYLLHFCYTA